MVQIRIHILAAFASALFGGTVHAAIISQSEFYGASGGANYGQRFELQSAFFSPGATLDSITFYKGNSGGGSATVWLDVYSLGTANIGSLDFSNGTETANLTYLGSSDNVVDYSAAVGSNAEFGNPAGDALVWNFSGITMPIDIPLFAVLSNDAVAGDFLGASLVIHNTSPMAPGRVFNNISDAVSDPMFGGTPSVVADQANFYSLSVSPAAAAIPEPSTFAILLGGLGLFLAVRRRI